MQFINRQQTPSHKTSVSNSNQPQSDHIRASGQIKKNKKEVDYIKILKSMKLEQDLRKIRNFKQLQKSMHKQKQQMSQIERQLEFVQQKIIEKKKQLIQKHIDQLEQKKNQRQQFIQQSNKQLEKVKLKNQQKKKNIELMIKQLQQKQLESYQKTLKQRVNRYRNPINFQDIKTHQKKYLELKSSLELKNSNAFQDKAVKKVTFRVKSQMSSPSYENQFENLSIDHKSRLDERIKDEYRQFKQKSKKKKLQLIKLVNKRNEYGNKMEQQKKKARVKTQHSQTKRQIQSRLFLENIQKENQNKINAKKPRLNTNLPKIDLKDYTKQSLKKIYENKSFSPIQKIEKLQAIQAFHMPKNNPESAEIITELSLIKADLLLKI